MMEVSVLLSLMIASSAEDSQLCLVDWGHSEEAKLKSDVLLDNVRSVMKQIKVCAFFSLQHPSCVSCNEKLFSSS